MIQPISNRVEEQTRNYSALGYTRSNLNELSKKILLPIWKGVQLLVANPHANKLPSTKRMNCLDNWTYQNATTDKFNPINISRLLTISGKHVSCNTNTK